MGEKKKKKYDLYYNNMSDKKNKKDKKDKKDKKKHKLYNYDYSNIICDDNVNMHKMMKHMARQLQTFVNYLDTCVIFESMSEEKWKKNMKTVKKLIKKLKKGDPSVFDIERLNEAFSDEHQLITGYKIGK